MGLEWLKHVQTSLVAVKTNYYVKNEFFFQSRNLDSLQLPWFTGIEWKTFAS